MLRQRPILASLALFCLPLSLAAQTPPEQRWWRPIGPAVYSNIVALAVAPSDPSAIYAATAGGGVARSSDFGQRFKTLPGIGLASSFVRSIAVDAGDPNRLLVGTEAGLFRSGDGGASWRRSVTPLPRVQAIAIDPRTPTSLVAGTQDGIFRSFDGGVRWVRVDAGLPSGPPFDVRALIADPLDRSRIWAAHVGFRSQLYESVDGGATWIPRYRGTIFALAADPRRPDVLWAATDRAVRRSGDGGRTFQRSLRLPATALAIDPVDPMTVYAATSLGMYRTLDDGATWTPIGLAWDSLSLRALAISPGERVRLLVGTAPAGIVYSEDRGETWIQSLGRVATTQISALASTEIGLFVGGPGALYRTADLGRNWSGLIAYDTIDLSAARFSPAVGWALARRVDDPDAPFVVLRTKNLGGDWRVVLALAGVSTGIACHPLDAEKAYVATEGGLLSTSDGGATWINLLERKVQCVAAAESAALYAGVGSQLFASDDGGTSWRVLLDGKRVGLGKIRRISIPSGQLTTLYLADRGAVYGTRDAGRTWRLVVRGLPEILAVAADPGHPERLTIGTIDGAFRSVDGGKTWSRFDDGMFGRSPVYSLGFDLGHPDRIYAGTSAGTFVRNVEP